MAAPHPDVPPAALWFGHLPQFARDPLDFLASCAKNYGDVVRLRFGPRPIYLLNHPTHIEYVLVTHSRGFRKTLGYRTPFMRRLFGEGLLTSEGPHWVRQRRLAQPAFHREQIARYAAITVDAADRCFASWPDRGVVEMHGEMLGLTTEIIVKTLFSSEVPPEIAGLKDASRAVMKQFTTQWKPWRLLLAWIPTPTYRRYHRAMRDLDAFIYRVVDARRKSKQPDDDLLAMLIHAQDEGGDGMTNEQLRDELVTLMVAGLDTTALTLTWLFYLLSRHPAVETSLTSEVERLLGSRPPQWADLPALRYTEAVVKETMRLYPAAWLIGRETLDPCQIGSHLISKHSSILLSQWVTHRDPRFFPGPEQFRPERWLSDPEPPRFAYFPFGGGPRTCIGNSFAMMEMVLIVARAAQGMRFSESPGGDIRPWASITLQPDREVWLKPRRAALVAN